jgi:putative ABC transport system substrate-binding protein
LGWADGRNLQIEYRAVGTSPAAIRRHVTEMVASKPEAILVSSSLVLKPLQQETRTIPIVFVQVFDPLGSGIVGNLARPGGNVTGFAPGVLSMGGKMLEVLKEAVPKITRAAVIMNPDQAPQVGLWRAIEAAAPSLAMTLTAIQVRDAGDVERGIDAFASKSNGGLVVLPNPITTGHRKLINTVASRFRLPAVYPYRFFVTDGGLLSYGSDPADQWRQAAGYVDRILKGEKPGDLPVQEPTRFELFINLKTAKTLGLDIPPMLLARADEVIE